MQRSILHHHTGVATLPENTSEKENVFYIITSFQRSTLLTHILQVNTGTHMVCIVLSSGSSGSSRLRSGDPGESGEGRCHVGYHSDVWGLEGDVSLQSEFTILYGTKSCHICVDPVQREGDVLISKDGQKWCTKPPYCTYCVMVFCHFLFSCSAKPGHFLLLP